MIVTVQADTKGSRQALRRLETLRRSAEPGEYEGLGATTLFSRVGIAVIRWVDQNFQTGGGKVGGWKPLSELTIFGRRGGSSLPLSNTGKLKQAVAFKAEPTEVRVGWAGELAKIARWQSEGTAGPYEIKPRFKKALAFPAPPLFALSAGVGFYAKRVTIGKKGAATPRATGIPRVGITTPVAIRAAGFKVPKGKGPIQAFAVVRGVMHPGLTPRRLLPTAEEAAAIAQPVVQDYIREAMVRRT